MKIISLDWNTEWSVSLMQHHYYTSGRNLSPAQAGREVPTTLLWGIASEMPLNSDMPSYYTNGDKSEYVNL